MDSEVVLVFERNNAGLKKLSEQTSDSSAFLNTMCLFLSTYSTVNSIFNFFKIFRSDLTVTGLARVYCALYAGGAGFEFRRDMNCSESPLALSLQANAGIMPEIGQGRFISHVFHLITLPVHALYSVA
jgi:hypothetical protein